MRPRAATVTVFRSRTRVVVAGLQLVFAVWIVWIARVVWRDWKSPAPPHDRRGEGKETEEEWLPTVDFAAHSVSGPGYKVAIATYVWSARDEALAVALCNSVREGSVLGEAAVSLVAVCDSGAATDAVWECFDHVRHARAMRPRHITPLRMWEALADFDTVVYVDTESVVLDPARLVRLATSAGTTQLEFAGVQAFGGADRKWRRAWDAGFFAMAPGEIAFHEMAASFDDADEPLGEFLARMFPRGQNATNARVGVFPHYVGVDARLETGDYAKWRGIWLGGNTSPIAYRFTNPRKKPWLSLCRGARAGSGNPNADAPPDMFSAWHAANDRARNKYKYPDRVASFDEMLSGVNFEGCW